LAGLASRRAGWRTRHFLQLRRPSGALIDQRRTRTCWPTPHDAAKRGIIYG